MPSMERERIQVEFLGETITVKGEADREEIDKIKDYLDQQSELLKSRFPYLTTKGLAVLTAFQLANELLQVRKDYEALISLLDQS